MPKIKACVLLQLNAPSTRAGATPASANVVDSAAAGVVEGMLLDVVAVGLTMHPRTNRLMIYSLQQLHRLRALALAQCAHANRLLWAAQRVRPRQRDIIPA